MKDLEKLIDIFFDLIKIEALSGNEKSVVDFITSRINKLEYYIDNSNRFSKSNTGNLVIKIGNGGNKILLAHMDTARPTKNVVPILNNNKITSNGESVLGVDNRAGIAILLLLLDKIINKEIDTVDFSVAFVTCEETTLMGSKNLQLSDIINEGYIFDSHLSPGKFIASSFGAISFNLKVFGKPAHSGIAPEQGINALNSAIDSLSKFKAGKIDENLTLNFGIVKGGSAINVVPEKVEIEGEIRSNSTEKISNFFDMIKNTFKEDSNKYNTKFESNYIWDFVPFNISNKSNTYQNIIKAIEKAGLIPEPSVSWGGSDANSLNERGIPSVNIGIGAKNPHSNEEYILLSDFLNAFKIAENLVKI